MFFAVAALALASCSKETTMLQENPAQNEIAVNAFSKPNTKGYVTTTTFGDITAPAGVNGAEFVNGKYRKMQISAYNETDKSDYFMGKTFKKGEGEAAVWHATPDKIYWPLGKTLSFLAYSVNDNNKGVSATWDGAKKVSLEVTKDASQDDILFSAANNLNAHSSTSDQGFSMVFDHAQSWLTIKVKVDGHSADDALVINAIEWTNIYNSGVLNIENNGTKAVAAWNFFTQTPGNVKMDDKTVTNPGETDPKYYQYETPVTKTVQVMDMLVPAQSHEGFVIKYVMNGIEGELPVATSEFTNTGDTWEMGKHYTYNLTFTVNEITVAPIVTVWDDEDLSYYYPSVKSIVKTAAECVSALDGVTFDDATMTVAVTTDSLAFRPNSADVNDNKVFKALKQFCDGLAPVDKIKYDSKEFLWNEGLKYWAKDGFSLEATIATAAFTDLGGVLKADGTLNCKGIGNGTKAYTIGLFYAGEEETPTDVKLEITIANPVTPEP